ncbi:MAG: hypothetical protein Q7K65_03510 [Candidatus Buchananbacteria bacterium]|nr:hypothetical protein [Candidatus Buchananbacteria bacterium]
MENNSTLVISGKIVALTWPIYIPVAFLLQFFNLINPIKLEKNLEDIIKEQTEKNKAA